MYLFNWRKGWGLHNETTQKDSSWVEDTPHLFLGSKVKITMYWFLKMLLSHYWFTFTHSHGISHAYPYESRICPIDLASKSQWSRSQCSDYWKWFMLHNCFIFTTIIIKRHTQTPHELRNLCAPYWCQVQKVRGQGHNTLIIIPSQQRWRGYSNAAVRGWLGEWVSGFVSEWVGGWVRAWVRPTLACGHDSDYSFWPITFKLHIHICHDERRNPIDYGSRGQRSRSTLALYK